MPRKRPLPAIEPPEGGPVMTDGLLDRFAPNRPLTGAEVEAASRRFKKALIERALGAELTHHLGYAAGAPKPEEAATFLKGAGLE